MCPLITRGPSEATGISVTRFWDWRRRIDGCIADPPDVVILFVVGEEGFPAVECLLISYEVAEQCAVSATCVKPAQRGRDVPLGHPH